MNTVTDLKVALSAIIDQIDRNKRFFLDAEDEEACAIADFSKRLKAKRDEMQAVLSEHEAKVNEMIGAALDRFYATRSRLKDASEAISALPDAYAIRKINELATALDAFSRIPDDVFAKIKHLHDQPTNQP